MKKYIVGGICVYIICQQYALFTNSSSLGKTHFIVGYPWYNTTVNETNTNRSYSAYKIPSTKTYFTSVHDVRTELETCLKQAKKSIAIACFTLTDTKVTDLLIRVHESGVVVTIITDRERMNDQYSKIEKLVRLGIPVFYYTHSLNPNVKQKRAKSAHMHHKFMIIDDTTLIFGSLNLTKAGQEENIENITITTKWYLVKDYKEEFKRLLLLSTKVLLTFFPQHKPV